MYVKPLIIYRSIHELHWDRLFDIMYGEISNLSQYKK